MDERWRVPTAGTLSAKVDAGGTVAEVLRADGDLVPQPYCFRTDSSCSTQPPWLRTVAYYLNPVLGEAYGTATASGARVN
jgi:hypothetical protein